MAVTASRSNRWLFGPLPDLMLGSGVLYGILILVFALVGTQIAQDNHPPYLLAMLTLAIGGPHYGGTLLRVYESRENRREYRLFAVYATLLIAAIFVWGVYSSLVAALFLTVYLTWSPWHYTGQNYGIAMMFLRRRGVEVTQAARRWLYWSFFLSYMLVFAVMHEADGQVDLPNAYDDPTTLAFMPLGISRVATRLLVPALMVGYLATLTLSAVELLRKASIRDLVPSACLVLTQALWFSAPMLVHHFRTESGMEALDGDFRAYYILWIAVAHSAQYLWVTTYYARSSSGWNGYGRYLGKVALAGTAVWTVPVILFSPDGIGRLSFDTGLALLVASAVNVHHFMLDGAIWKLRNSRIARILLRNRTEEVTDAAPRPTSPWPRRLVWSGATIALIIQCYVFTGWHVRYLGAYRAGEHATATVILDRLAWFGFDRATPRVALGRKAGERGDLDEAMVQFQRSVELRPKIEGYDGIAQIHVRRKQWSLAAESYARAIELDPEYPDLLYRAALVELRLEHAGTARDYLHQALSLDPDHAPSHKALERAQRKLDKQAQADATGTGG